MLLLCAAGGVTLLVAVVRLRRGREDKGVVATDRVLTMTAFTLSKQCSEKLVALVC